MISYFLKKSFYPAHPERVVIKSKYYKEPLREEDVWSYYHAIKKRILPYLLNRKILLRVATDMKETIVRHDPKTKKVLEIKNELDFDRLNNGRTLSFYTESERIDDHVRIDLDPEEDFPFERVKSVAIQIANLLKKTNFFEGVEISFSGRRGFHIRGYFKENITTNTLNHEIKELLKVVKFPEDVPSLPD